MSCRVMWLVVALLIGRATPAFANWTLNLGYNNPPGATVGINLLYWGSKLGFEIGAGWVDASAHVDDDDDDTDDDDDKASFAIAGDVNIKYFLASGGVVPYLQGGFGLGLAGTVGDDNSASAGIGGPFAGIGLMAGGKDLYLYLSANANSNSHTFVQAGVGFDI